MSKIVYLFGLFIFTAFLLTGCKEDDLESSMTKIADEYMSIITKVEFDENKVDENRIYGDADLLKQLSKYRNGRSVDMMKSITASEIFIMHSKCKVISYDIFNVSIEKMIVSVRATFSDNSENDLLICFKTDDKKNLYIEEIINYTVTMEVIQNSMR